MLSYERERDWIRCQTQIMTGILSGDGHASWCRLATGGTPVAPDNRDACPTKLKLPGPAGTKRRLLRVICSHGPMEPAARRRSTLPA
jgi:hypothetical protein